MTYFAIETKFFVYKTPLPQLVVLIMRFSLFNAAFRCCYCGAPNPARKSRMNAPPLEDPRSSDQESDKEKAHKEEAETRDDDNSNQEEEQTCQGERCGDHIFFCSLYAGLEKIV